jgi:hypothetical protein
LAGDHVLAPTRTTKQSSVELLCQWIKTKAMLSLQVEVKEFKKCCTSDKVDGRKNEDKAGNGGSEHENVSSECVTKDKNCEDNEAKRVNKNGEQSETGEAK